MIFLEVVISVYHPKKPLDILFRECYYIHIGEGNQQRPIPVIDDCCYDLVFFKEASGTFYYGSEVQEVPINSKVFTIHQARPPYKVKAKDSLTFFTIKLQPWANAYFFSSLLGSGVVDINGLNNQWGGFYQQVFELDNTDDQFALAERFMEEMQFSLTPSMELVREICEYVYKNEGKVTVNQLSEHFNRSRQYLGKVFKKEVMYPLKKFIITVRILDLVKYKSKNPDVSLTQLSYDYGYFDQPHFINDFKKVCGVKPLQFFNNLPEFMLRHQ
ncbi:MAG: helix-turn-helix transcriptional regulator [Bacteroidota bacterium]|nr:helix-turn-helix transcriptional regulator [Bacteroidota bacterium]